MARETLWIESFSTGRCCIVLVGTGVEVSLFKIGTGRVRWRPGWPKVKSIVSIVSGQMSRVLCLWSSAKIKCIVSIVLLEGECPFVNVQVACEPGGKPEGRCLQERPGQLTPDNDNKDGKRERTRRIKRRPCWSGSNTFPSQ